MSFSWVVPSSAALHARREEQRVAEELLRAVREREQRLEEHVHGAALRTEPVWLDPVYAFERLRVF